VAMHAAMTARPERLRTGDPGARAHRQMQMPLTAR